MKRHLKKRLRELPQLGVDDLLDIGCDLADAGLLDDAEACFRRAVELGSATAAFNLANGLAEEERWPEAIRFYEMAVRGDVVEAWLNLGSVLHELGDLAGEMHAYRRAEAEGDSGGPLALAFALRDQGEREAALDAAQRSAAAGHPVAPAVVACWQWCTTQDPALEKDLRAGADSFPSARADLAHLLMATGRVDEARRVLELGMKLGEVESMLPLGNLYADILEDDAAAEAAYRAGASCGDPHSHHNLAVLLEERGDLNGAERHYRLAIDGGDTLAIRSLRNLLDD